jgi:glycosyltransferase involved in cell wall biosynthesis
LFAPRIANLGHDLLLSCPFSFGGSPLEYEGIPVFGAIKDQAGNDSLLATYGYFNADLLLTLCDVFALLPMRADLTKMNVAHWMPVDCNPMGEADVTVLREGGGIPVAMSTFGEQIIRAEGATPIFRVPHGVDTQLFSPGDGTPYRESADIGPDTFVIGILAMNRDLKRKAMFEQCRAFAAFHNRHPDSVLTMHTAPTANPGLNLTGMAARLGITDAVRFPDEYSYAMALITREQQVSWYRGLDVLSNCSYGEGFGLAALEAQSCGVPVVLTNGSTGPELCGSGWLVSGTPDWAPGHGAEWVRPDITDIDAAYEAAWQARENGAMPNGPAREFALQYDADLVLAQHWKPVLEELERLIG